MMVPKYFPCFAQFLSYYAASVLDWFHAFGWDQSSLHTGYRPAVHKKIPAYHTGWWDISKIPHPLQGMGVHYRNLAFTSVKIRALSQFLHSSNTILFSLWKSNHCISLQNTGSHLRSHRHIFGLVHSEMKGWLPTGCISMREGRTGVQPTAAESTLFAQQAELTFHAWLFLGGVYTQECLHWLGFPHWT